MPHNTQLFSDLSSSFSVKETHYGGRGCFANVNIPSGTVILLCTTPLGACVIRPFRKEVCQRCYSYNGGKTLKHRIESKKGSVYFCSQECKSAFEAENNSHLLVSALHDLEHWYRSHAREEDYNEGKSVDEAWQEVEQWEASLKNRKRNSSLVPDITEIEYSDIIYILDVLFAQYNQTNQLELAFFDELQSSEYEKVAKYPYLITSYTTMYKYLKLTCPSQLQPLVTVPNIRKIIGTSLTNAFGIWSKGSPEEDKEYYGCALYPSASYLNHSCAANVTRVRNGRLITFLTSRDIQPGEELCIQYGNHIDEEYEIRQKDLKEWFFDCGCKRCEADKKLFDNKNT